MKAWLEANWDYLSVALFLALVTSTVIGLRRGTKGGALFVSNSSAAIVAVAFYPVVESFNYNIVKMTFPVTLISTGPGNLDALRQLLNLTAALVTKNIAVMSASPKVVTLGGQEFAGYEVIIPLQAQNG